MALVLPIAVPMENIYSKSILLVDDEAGYLKALTDHLKADDCPACILTAENGEKALDVLESVHVDLIVTDLHMPVMDGFKLISEVKKRHPKIPIIVVSSFLFSVSEERLSALGASHIIEKFDVDALRDKILQTVGNSYVGIGR